MVKRIEKITREAISTNKYKAGSREVMKSVRGSKLIIISDSMAKRIRDKLENQASTSKVPIYHFRGTSLQLARLCGAPYKISAISLKAGNSEDINSILQDKD